MSAKTMMAAAALLADIGAVWEHPGHIEFTVRGITFRFGDPDGDGYKGEFEWGNDSVMIPGRVAPLSYTAEQLNLWIRLKVGETITFTDKSLLTEAFLNLCAVRDGRATVDQDLVKRLGKAIQ